MPVLQNRVVRQVRNLLVALRALLVQKALRLERRLDRQVRSLADRDLQELSQLDQDRQVQNLEPLPPALKQPDQVVRNQVVLPVQAVEVVQHRVLEVAQGLELVQELERVQALVLNREPLPPVPPKTVHRRQLLRKNRALQAKPSPLQNETYLLVPNGPRLCSTTATKLRRLLPAQAQLGLIAPTRWTVISVRYQNAECRTLIGKAKSKR